VRLDQDGSGYLTYRTGDYVQLHFRGRDRHEVFRRLASATDFLGDQTGEHCQRVARNATVVGRALGLSDDHIEHLSVAATLHDIGKVSVPRSILLKPGRLTPAEFLVVQGHAPTGAILLSGSDIPELNLAASIARSHHERWDGSGYPNRVAKSDIPIEARIVGVCDTFDALSNVRPYKDAWTPEASIAHIRDESGEKFDPSVVDAFIELFSRGKLLTGACA